MGKDKKKENPSEKTFAGNEYGYMVVLCLFVLLMMGAGIFAKPTVQVGATVDQIEDPVWFWGSIRTHNFSALNIRYGEELIGGNYEYITREAYAKLLFDTFGLREDFEGPPTFSDIPDYHRAFSYIENTKDYITAFYPPKGKPFFAPEQYVTREDIISSLVRIMELSSVSSESLAQMAQQIQSQYQLLDYNKITPQLRFDVMQAIKSGLVEPLGVEGSYTISPKNYVDKTEALNLIYGALKSSSARNKLNDGAMYFSLKMPDETADGTVVIEGDTVLGNQVFINEEKIEVLRKGATGTEVAFQSTYQLPSEGVYDFVIKVIDINGREKNIKRIVTYHLKGAAIEIYGDTNTVNQADYMLNGKVRYDENIAYRAYLNDEPLILDEQGFFTQKVTLLPGKNVFKVALIGDDGTTKESTKTITFKPKGPSIYGLDKIKKSTEEKTLRVSGTVQDENDDAPKVFINDKSIKLEKNGYFEMMVSLNQGENEIVIVAENRLGQTSKKTLKVERTRPKPKLEVKIDQNAIQNPLKITGKIIGEDLDMNETKVWVNGQTAKLYRGSTFAYIMPLKLGENKIEIRLTEKGIETASYTTSVLFEEGSPILNVPAIKETTLDRIVISGTVEDTNLSQIKLEVNGVPVAVDKNGVWRCVAHLSKGENEIIVVAENQYGKTAHEKIIVVRK